MLWGWPVETTESSAPGTSDAQICPDRRWKALLTDLEGGKPVHTAAGQHQTLKHPALAHLETYHYLWVSSPLAAECRRRR